MAYHDPIKKQTGWCHLKNDYEVKLYMSERQQGKTQKQAAARAGMSERTARKYEQAAALPSALKRPHDWQTRSNPFEEDWPWIIEQLERDPALQSTTLFALLCERHPDRYRPTQDRTLRRHIARWRVLHGPEKDIIFEQVHTPGERAQSDFTHMEDVGVTIAGEPFPHLVYHFVLTYSNVEAAFICFSETFEALAEGIENSLWQIGGVPQQHRTDHLSAAVRQLRKEEKEDWTTRYSVPSRLIGTTILVRVRSEHLEGYVGATRVFEIPRLIGKHHHRIDYHHVIHSLVRKPGAFAAYRYPDDLFPTTTFRQTYDRLVEGSVKRADREYVRILHLAATTSEAEVETALQIVLEEHKVPSFLTVRDLVQVPPLRLAPTIAPPELNLASYDQLIPSVRYACV